MSAPRCALLLAASLAACDNALDQRLANIDEPRVLAVVAQPAEAKPGATVTYTAIVAGPDGALAIDAAWSFCKTPKAPTEDNAVSAGCIDGSDLIDLGTGEMAAGTLPTDACLRFGPDTPPVGPNDPPGGFRPRDPDPTGGYYQPVRVDTDGLASLAFGLSRIKCKLANAPTEASFAYETRYIPNTNPAIESFSLASTDRVAASTDIELSLSWSADAAEAYISFDVAHQALVDRRESMRVSWYATGGELAIDASSIAEDDSTTTVSTVWHTPTAGPATVWAVLRDSRGGVVATSAAVTVE